MGEARQYWLLKSEPGVYAIDDLRRDGVTCWEGVRNYQARNFLRAMRVGDGVLFYHSQVPPLGIYGVAEVVRAAYPDDTAFDPASPYYDPKSDPARPTWYMVDIRYVGRFQPPLSLARLRQVPALQDMLLLRRGNRLSVQPVTPQQWDCILGLAKLVP